MFMKNFILVITGMVLFSSCGSGVKDRQISTSTSQSSGNSGLTLSPLEIASLAESRIAAELDPLYISEYYVQAKSRFNIQNFAKISDFLLVNCVDSQSSQAVNNFKDYGKLLQDANSQDHVIALIDEIILILNSQEQSSLSANQLAVLLKAIEKANTYRSQIAAKATQCKSVVVKGVTGEESDPAPLSPSED